MSKVGKQTIDPSHNFYTSTSGIWQTVFLEPVPKTYVTKIDVFADMHGQGERVVSHFSSLSKLFPGRRCSSNLVKDEAKTRTLIFFS